jgi:hypothetical protein
MKKVLKNIMIIKAGLNYNFEKEIIRMNIFNLKEIQNEALLSYWRRDEFELITELEKRMNSSGQTRDILFNKWKSFAKLKITETGSIYNVIHVGALQAPCTKQKYFTESISQQLLPYRRDLYPLVTVIENDHQVTYRIPQLLNDWVLNLAIHQRYYKIDYFPTKIEFTNKCGIYCVDFK